MKNAVISVVVLILIAGAVLMNNLTQNAPQANYDPIDTAFLSPDWSAIAAWPPESSDTSLVQANPDPAQVTTLILLDDSGSMGGRMSAAKDAVTEAVAQFAPDTRVGVVALNAGLVLPVTEAREAARVLPERLRPIEADGTTPLGARLAEAANILTEEARRRRGFGTFRILVTTDGDASDGNVMNAAVTQILSATPIELATIGVGIGEGHALNVPGYTNYVSVTSVDDLAGALQAAAAEQTVFQPITKFED